MVKKERRCPCGSGIAFSECCRTPVDGSTPSVLINNIKNSIIKTFNYIGDTRGELCVYVSLLVKDLLDLNNIKSYVAAGEARWNNFQYFYRWAPQGNGNNMPEFHAWVITQYGEICDLACDAFESRHDVSNIRKIQSPKMCWDKNLNDRVYIPHDLGLKNINYDRQGYQQLKEIAFSYYDNEYGSKS